MKRNQLERITREIRKSTLLLIKKLHQRKNLGKTPCMQELFRDYILNGIFQLSLTYLFNSIYRGYDSFFCITDPSNSLMKPLDLF